MPSSRMYVYGTWVLSLIHTYLSEQAGLGFARTMCWYSVQGYYIYMALPDKKYRLLPINLPSQPLLFLSADIIELDFRHRAIHS